MMSKLSMIFKPAYFFLTAGILCIVCLFALRANNAEMVQLRAEVYRVDQLNGDVRSALTKLQHHVTAHMNTDLTPGNNTVYPPIQLKYTYERLQAANNKNLSNEQVYIDAQAECERLNPNDFSGRNRIPCIQQYVSSHGAAAPATIPDSLYKYDFVSPSWSPDLAGWSMVLTIIFLTIGSGLIAFKLVHRRLKKS